MNAEPGAGATNGSAALVYSVLAYLALVGALLVAARSGWLLWLAEPGGTTPTLVAGLVLALVVVQPLATWALGVSLGWSRSASGAVAAMALAVPGIGLLLPWVRGGERELQRSIEPHPIAVAAAELPIDLETVLAADAHERHHAALTAQPPAVTMLRFGQPADRLAALATAAAVDQPVAWRAVAEATADPVAEVRDRAAAIIEQRRTEYELELAALAEVEDGGWSEQVRCRDYALSELHSPRQRDTMLERVCRFANGRRVVGDPSEAWRWTALAVRLALDRDRPNDALEALERVEVPAGAEPTASMLRAEALAGVGQMREARALAISLRADGHELPPCLLALCPRRGPRSAAGDEGER